MKDKKEKTNYRDRAIALDMDGVVINGMPFNVKAWQRTFMHFLKLKVTELEIYLAEGVKAEEFINQIALKYGKTLSSREITNIHKFKREYFNNIFFVEPIPGIIDFIAILKKMAYPLGLVTGSSYDVAKNALLSLSLLSNFNCIISGEDTRYGKPSPDPYLLAAKKMRVSKNQCLVIENAPSGIASAKSANMVCLAVETSLSSEYLQLADIIQPNIKELQKLLIEEYSISEGVGPWNFKKRF